MYVIVTAPLTIADTALNLAHLIPTGAVRAGWLRIIFIILGVSLIIAGITLWIAAVVGARVMRHIDNGQLVASRVYAWVRHPIYSAFMLTFTGILLAQANLWLLTLPPVFWLFLTILMKHTEERWLHAAFGKSYADYSRRVNRCIPAPPLRIRRP
ncbi:MAG: isoprenylcysteine carboxylmethyltransferase family protein [Bowdeniella nasicola]|nr:isoprenylcysteine carboxylmethyltransferase family protein [Bowdeniella nasicola]